MRISELLYKAANECLWPGIEGLEVWNHEGLYKYICLTLNEALPFDQFDGPIKHETVLYLKSFGMPLDGTGFLKTGPLFEPKSSDLSQWAQQQTRYAFMMLASMVAEEEGL